MIAGISWIATLLAGIATLVIAIFISADVLLRYFFNSPLLFVDAVASVLLVLVIFGGLAYTFLSGSASSWWCGSRTASSRRRWG